MATQGDKSVSPLTQEEIEALVDKCIEAKSKAHAKYSRFRVGSALLTEDGAMYTGCNIENVVYPLTICAERCAIFKAVSDGHRRFRAISVTTDIKGCFASPCGSCRQVMAEFGRDYLVVLTKPDRTTRIHTVGELLPHTFTDAHLQAGQEEYESSDVIKEQK